MSGGVLLLAASAAQAAPAISEAQARALAARQEAAWNARDLDAYFATFTPDAVFIDQTRDVKHGGMIPYGRSDLKQARAQAAKFLAGATFVERGVVERVEIAAGGREATLIGRETSTVVSKGRTRRACAQTRQTLVLAGGTLKSKGQTDTIVRCPK
jgi:uncharacterized protein (TIGR02246 family)